MKVDESGVDSDGTAYCRCELDHGFVGFILTIAVCKVGSSLVSQDPGTSPSKMLKLLRATVLLASASSLGFAQPRTASLAKGVASQNPNFSGDVTQCRGECRPLLR